MINIFISKCLCIETANKKCEAVVPKDILAKRLTTISILSLLLLYMNEILLKYQLILEVDLVLFPGIDLVTALQWMMRRHKQYLI